MPLLSIEEAAALLCRRTAPVSRRETLPLLQALGRTAAAEVTAVTDQPPFDRSLLDGYALRRTDLPEATREAPVRLPVCRTLMAGDPPGAPLPTGQAVRVMTGAPVPAGADCVLRQEDTDGGAEAVLLYAVPPLSGGIRRRGADLPAGALLVAAGTALTPAHLALLAEQGFAEIEGFARPRVGLLITGDELAEPGQAPAPGKIAGSNSVYLAARLTQLGLEPVISPVHDDDPERLAAALSALLAECGAVITTGGTADGQRDHMPRLHRLPGSEPLFRGVAVKPGNHTMAALIGGKPVVSLPGTPAAAALMLEVIARPMLLKLAGRREYLPRRSPALLAEPSANPSPLRQLRWAHQEGGTVFLSSQAEANCLLDLPPNSPALPAGTKVEVISLC